MDYKIIKCFQMLGYGDMKNETYLLFILFVHLFFSLLFNWRFWRNISFIVVFLSKKWMWHCLCLWRRLHCRRISFTEELYNIF